MNPQLQQALYEKHQAALQSASSYVASVGATFEQIPKVPFFGNQERYWTIGWCQFYGKMLSVEMRPLPEPDDAIRRSPTSQFAKFQGGYIAKTEQALRAAGYNVTVRRSPNHERLTTTPEANAPMDVAISARQRDADGRDDYDGVSISVTFYAVVPEKALDDPACHVEYTPVEVPAHTEYVARVVCDDDDSKAVGEAVAEAAPA